MRTLLLLCLALLGPATAHAESRTAQQPVVYGQDDRLDVADHPDANLQTLAEEAIVAFVRRSQLQATSTSFSVGGPTLGTSQALCEGERFAEQIAAGFCSGTLIGPDLVLTAGHCIESEPQCNQTALLFNYHWSNGGIETIGEDDVYLCRRIIARDLSESTEVRDYAIIQLDRPVSGRTPAQVVDRRGALDAGMGFAILGSPSGIPVKIDDGGTVRDARSASGDYFVGTPDSFGGNSGSGIFDLQSRALFGMLISGETDYVSEGNCQRVNVCSETDCGGENMLYPGMAIDAFCSVATDGELCNTPAECGDGFCAAEERDSCTSDCEPIVCGNEWCEGDEWTSCPDDCVVAVPSTWTCDPSWYAVGDDCDCNCGAYDPDCDLPLPVLNCGAGQTCGADGTCEGGFGDGSFCDVGPNAPRVSALALVGLAALFGLVIARRREERA